MFPLVRSRSRSRFFGTASTLNFNFVDGSPFPGQITFTRASSATYFDSAGVLQSAAIDVPRFDFDPSTLAAQGLLIEEQRTNLFQRSEEFNDAYWTLLGATVSANSTAAPTGTNVADTLTEDTSTGEHRIGSSLVAWVGNTQYTVTFFVKANGRTRIDILLGTAGNWVNGDLARVANFNLTTGTVATAPISPGTASIQAIGNGWFRCSITATTVAAPSASGVFIRLCDATGSASYTGNGTSGAFLFGAQLEAGAFPTSYIPTTTTALTRSADVASVNTLTPWFNAAQGTIYAEASVPVAAAYSGYVYMLGTFNDGIMFFRQSDFQPVNRVRVSASDQFINGFGAIWTTTGVFKNAQSYGTNDFAGVVNGGAVATDTSGTVPTVSVLNLGSTGSGSALNGHLRRITYYSRAFAGAQLQQITA